MRVLYLEMDFKIYQCESLKVKRNISNSLAEKLRNKFNVSVAQKHFPNQKNKFMLGICSVSINLQQLDKLRQRIVNYIDNSEHEIEVDAIHHEIL
ncbi:DUF503 domain-containing protein [Proteinivorax tanatarense]|uniref:DUF503 domain-containing protein n=1 Tax=Proteinivorax tanatarense TaxID=1260629 RepID=A0AAU7VML5_9FIRM